MTSNERLEFDVDQDHDTDPGILKEFLPLRDGSNIVRILAILLITREVVAE